jgi:FkbH-like protein
VDKLDGYPMSDIDPVSDIDPAPPARPLTPQMIHAVYNAVLGRPPENNDVIEHFVATSESLESFIRQAISSAEFGSRYKPPPPDRPSGYERHSRRNYLVPTELRVHETPLSRVLLVGSCGFDTWPDVLQRGGVSVTLDRLHLDSHPDVAPLCDPSAYDFQLSQIHMRAVMPDHIYFRWIRGAFTDVAACRAMFEEVCREIDRFFDRVTAWKDKLPVFLMNFLLPQGSLTGRLLDRYELTNNVSFMEELNRYLYSRVKQTANVHLLDADAVAASFGRRYVQDDSMWVSNHAAHLNDSDVERDKDRIVKVAPPSQHYALDTEEFIFALWLEAESMLRTLRQLDSVKMICVDIDDTLWHGVQAEADYVDINVAIEGWPVAIAEALAVLKRRGIILALVSKNTAEIVERIWKTVYAQTLPLEDFAIKKINWRPKSENIAEALAEANLLPRNVVFLDDNPVERAAARQAFPDLRVIDSSHYYWKRILLWSPETQPAVITTESTQRTDMIKAQIARETQRKAAPREEFLRDLQLQVTASWITGQQDPRFPRTLELLNKTNQFNTTGVRWTAQSLDQACRDGTVMTCEVADRHSAYGLVLVAIASTTAIEQVVMSCRVIGMDVEIAAIALLVEKLLRNTPVVHAVMKDTDANLLSRSLFDKCGWTLYEGRWQTGEAGQIPAHVHLQGRHEEERLRATG